MDLVNFSRKLIRDDNYSQIPCLIGVVGAYKVCLLYIFPFRVGSFDFWCKCAVIIFPFCILAVAWLTIMLY